MDITECLPFQRLYESKARIWEEPSEVPFILNDHDLALSVLDEVINLSLKNKQ